MFSAVWAGNLWQCTNVEPAKPPVVQDAPLSVPDSQFCATIAPRPAPTLAVGVKGKYWQNGQTIRIKFIGGTTAQRKFVKDAFSEWANIVNLNFTYPTSGKYECRVSFATGDGSWSYIGLDNATIPASYSTMNIGWSGLDVCLHEIGHFLGMAHEQANPISGICWNEANVIRDLSGAPNNWTVDMIRHNVFDKANPNEVDATPFDGVSIMQYSVPNSWTCNGVGIPGGTALSATDKAFASGIYPKPGLPPVTGKALTAEQVARLNAISDEIKAMVK